jgi:hypothetical protein
MNQLYNHKKTVVLKADGSPTPISVKGNYFRCIATTAGRFEVSFDGQEFFEWQKGLAFGPMIEAFTMLSFRILNGTNVGNTIEFYYGNVPVQDSRLNLIDGSAASTVYIQEPPFITFYLWSGPFLVTDDINLDGFRTIGGRTLYRRSLEIVTDWSPSTPVAGSAIRRLSVTTVVGGSYPLSGQAQGVILQTVYGVAHRISGSEPLFISNASGGTVPMATIYETFWNPS